MSELQKTLKKAQQTWLGPALLALWILLGVLTLKMTSVASCLVIMSTTLLIHSVYGSVVVFTQVVVFIGESHNRGIVLNIVDVMCHEHIKGNSL